ncbi:MAG: hypothetical protein Kow00124_29480 [Anaerolineae bacterium]
MSANATTWFFNEPEHQPYLITERLNGSFWQARIVEVYWKCVRAEPPFRAVGYMSGAQLELEWVPGMWLALHVPAGVDAGQMAETVSRRVLGMRPSASYEDPEGRTVYEWHTEAAKGRWNEMQGRAEFNKLKRLK